MQLIEIMNLGFTRKNDTEQIAGVSGSGSETIPDSEQINFSKELAEITLPTATQKDVGFFALGRMDTTPPPVDATTGIIAPSIGSVLVAERDTKESQRPRAKEAENVTDEASATLENLTAPEVQLAAPIGFAQTSISVDGWKSGKEEPADEPNPTRQKIPDIPSPIFSAPHSTENEADIGEPQSPPKGDQRSPNSEPDLVASEKVAQLSFPELPPLAQNVKYHAGGNQPPNPKAPNCGAPSPLMRNVSRAPELISDTDVSRPEEPTQPPSTKRTQTPIGTTMVASGNHLDSEQPEETISKLVSESTNSAPTTPTNYEKASALMAIHSTSSGEIEPWIGGGHRRDYNESSSRTTPQGRPHIEIEPTEQTPPHAKAISNVQNTVSPGKPSQHILAEMPEISPASDALSQSEVIRAEALTSGAIRNAASSLPIAQHAAPQTSLPNQINAQIRAALATDAKQDIEVQLAPEDLGRLRIVLSPKDSGISVSIFSDNSDTLNLIRRNTDLLETSFAEEGYSHASFTFEQDRSDHPRCFAPPSAQTDPEIGSVEIEYSQSTPYHKDSPLDLRL